MYGRVRRCLPTTPRSRCRCRDQKRRRPLECGPMCATNGHGPAPLPPASDIASPSIERECIPLITCWHTAAGFMLISTLGLTVCLRTIRLMRWRAWRMCALSLLMSTKPKGIPSPKKQSGGSRRFMPWNNRLVESRRSA